MRRFLFALLALSLASAQAILLVKPAYAASAPTISSPVDGSTTTERRPLLQGTWDPSEGGDLSVTFDGVEVFTDSAGIPGGETERDWAYQLIAQDPGEHTVTASFTSLAGDTGSASSTFTIFQPVPGTPTVLEPLDGALTGSQVGFAGLVGDGGTVGTALFVVVDDGNYLAYVILENNAVEWSLTLTNIADGSHTAYANVRDNQGNFSARSNTVTFTVDTTAPAVPAITFPADGYYENENVTFRGTGEPGSTLTIIYEFGTFTLTVPPSGEWEQDAQPLELGEGTHTFSVRQTDPAGNQSPTSADVTYTYDATAPAPPLIEAPETGDTVTDEAFAVAGRGEIGATVTVSIDGQSVGTALVDSNGDWLLTEIPALSNGPRVITATQADRADNESTVSNTVTIEVEVVDSTVPDAPVITEPVEGLETNDQTPTIRGTGEPGATLTLVVKNSGGVAVQTLTVIVPGSGEWEATAESLNEGTYTLTATQTDPAGNTSEPSAPRTFILDRTPPPSPVVTSPVDGAFVGTATTFIGTGEPGNIIQVRIGSNVLGQAQVALNGSWSILIGLPEGRSNVFVGQVDTAGNGQEPVLLRLTVDTTAPAAPTVNEPVAGQRVGSEVTVKGLGERGATVTVRVGGLDVGTALVNSAGAWELVTDALDDGDVTLSVTQTDPAGNESAAVEVAVVIDTTAPAAPVVTEPANGTVFPRFADVTFRGTGEPGATVNLRFDDGNPQTVDRIATVLVDGLGNWEQTPDPVLPDGSYSVTATQTNAAGNVSIPSAPRTITVDTTPPAEPGVTSPTNGATVPARIPFSGTGEPGAKINVNVFQDLVGTTVVQPDGTWSLITIALPDGPVSLSVQQVDLAGNASESAVLLDLIVDSTAPPAPVIIAPAQSTSMRVALTGTGEPGSVITVLIDGDAYAGTATVGTNGQWALDVVGLAPGSYTFTATATNPAGNVSPESAPVEIQVVAAPVIEEPVDGQAFTILRPTFTGTGEPGATIVVRVESMVNAAAVLGSLVLAPAAAPGDVLAIGVVNPDGEWSATPTTDLDLGIYRVVAEQSVAGIAAGVSEVVVFAVVAEPVITSPVNGSEVDEIFEVCGTGEPGFTVQMVDFADIGDEDAPAYAETEVRENGTWCVDVIVSDDGAYRLVAQQSINGEFEAVSGAVSVTVQADSDDDSDSDDDDDDSDDDSDNDSNDNDSDRTLAATGGPAAAFGLVGLALIGLGGLSMHISRRRRLGGRRG